MFSAEDLQDITERFESLLEEMKARGGSPSRDTVKSEVRFGQSPRRKSSKKKSPRKKEEGPPLEDPPIRLLFSGTPARHTSEWRPPASQASDWKTPWRQSSERKSPGTQLTSRRLTFVPAPESPYHSACILPAQKVEDISAQVKKELQAEVEKRRKLEQSLSHVQEELNKTKSMAEDINQSKRLSLAMLKQLLNEYTKLQKKHDKSIRNLQLNESLQRTQSSALAVHDRRLPLLSEQLKAEVHKRMELEDQLKREQTVRASLQEELNNSIKQRDQLEDQMRRKQVEVRSVSPDDHLFQDCLEDPQPETLEQRKLLEPKDAKQPVKENDKISKNTSDKSVDTVFLSLDADQLLHRKNKENEKLSKKASDESVISTYLSLDTTQSIHLKNKDNEKLSKKTLDKSVDTVYLSFDTNELINEKNKENEKLPGKETDKSVNTVYMSLDPNELSHLKNRCAELEKQLSEKSEELSAAKKHCNEQESHLKELMALGKELDDYRVQELQDIQTAYAKLQEDFVSAKNENNTRLEEKEKLITTLKENERLVNTENETLKEIVKDLNELAKSYLERIQELTKEKVKQEEALREKVKELKEKEHNVSETACELKVIYQKCSEQEKQIKELQMTINSLEDKYGNLTVESATYACENVVRRECLEDDIERKREVLREAEEKLESKNKILERQAYTIVQLRCRLLKQEREIQSLQAELDRFYEDNERSEEDIKPHNYDSKMEHLEKERDNAVQSAMNASHKLQLLQKLLHMYLKREAKIFHFLKYQVLKKHQRLVKRKLQQIHRSDAQLQNDFKRIMSTLLNKRRDIQ